jgi:hypothetical protein
MGLGSWDKSNKRERPSGIYPDLHIRPRPVVLYFSLLHADTPIDQPCSVISVVFTNKKVELKFSKFKMFLNAFCVFLLALLFNAVVSTTGSYNFGVFRF